MVKTGGVETPKLKSYIERIERLEEEKSGLGADIRDVFGEAKSNGFATKTMRDIIKLRKLAASIRTEQEYMLDLYKRALGMDHGMDDDEADEAAREAAGRRRPPRRSPMPISPISRSRSPKARSPASAASGRTGRNSISPASPTGSILDPKPNRPTA